MVPLARRSTFAKAVSDACAFDITVCKSMTWFVFDDEEQPCDHCSHRTRILHCRVFSMILKLFYCISMIPHLLFSSRSKFDRGAKDTWIRLTHPASCGRHFHPRKHSTSCCSSFQEHSEKRMGHGGCPREWNYHRRE